VVLWLERNSSRSEAKEKNRINQRIGMIENKNYRRFDGNVFEACDLDAPKIDPQRKS